jgi:GTP-binding protein Era
MASAAQLRERCGHIAIVGRPSVGKSTLLNALVGTRISITSRKPQTTRHRITGILTEADIQYVFVDTPGFQTGQRSLLNERLHRAVRQGLAGVDVVVLVVDAGRHLEADREVATLCPAARPLIAALNKIDAIADKRRLLPRIAQIASWRDFAAIVPVSAERGSGLDQLKGEIARYLPVAPMLYPEDEVTDRDERFLAAEFIREKIFRQLGDEVPYSTAVTIEAFEQHGALRRILAAIHVDRPGQRAILVGAGGTRMKSIASAARADMETLFGGRVFLEVHVRVDAGWMRNAAMLTRLGY